jgi:nitroreductase
MFDAGIAAQTFSLAAYKKGLSTVIMGIFEGEKFSKILGLPENESVATIIPYGYETEHPNKSKRKPAEEVIRYL